MKTSVLAGLLLALLAAPGAWAAPKSPQLGEIVAQQGEIRSGVIAGTGRYKDMAPATKTALLARQAEVLALLEGKQSMSELSEVEGIKVFNGLEWIEAAVNNAEDERVTCVRERKTGSNRPVRVCRTQREIREARERARRQMSEGSMPIDI